jgi:Cu+-exporting ATPase
MTEAKKTFSIKGMHCASCVVLLERALKQVSGVSQANVNLATEKATVLYDAQLVSDTHLKDAVAGAGYHALLEDRSEASDDEKNKQKELRIFKLKVIVSLFLGGLIFWGSFPGLMKTSPMFLQNFWVQLFLAIPVQLWAGLDFYRAAFSSLKHRSANMDTLVVMGTTVAFVYSVFVTIMPSVVETAGFEAMPYFDVSTVIILSLIHI